MYSWLEQLNMCWSSWEHLICLNPCAIGFQIALFKIAFSMFGLWLQICFCVWSSCKRFFLTKNILFVHICFKKHCSTHVFDKSDRGYGSHLVVFKLWTLDLLFNSCSVFKLNFRTHYWNCLCKLDYGFEQRFVGDQ